MTRLSAQSDDPVRQAVDTSPDTFLSLAARKLGTSFFKGFEEEDFSFRVIMDKEYTMMDKLSIENMHNGYF
jgi:hypothetical protein